MIVLAYKKNIILQAPLYLSPKEMVSFEKLKGIKSGRQAEWLAGRIAVKKAIKKSLKSGSLSYPQIEIMKDALGKPYFKNTKISISHIPGFAVADTHQKKNIGVDIEKIRRFTKPVFESFLKEEERKWIRGKPRIKQNLYSSLFWSLKEAYLKALGVGLRIHPKNIEVRPSNNDSFAIHSQYSSTIKKPWYTLNIRDGYLITKVII